MQQKMPHRNLRNFRYVQGVDTTEYSETAYERKDKLLLYEQLIDDGCSPEMALIAIKTPRSTYFRWRKKYNLYGLAGLENESTRPHTIRKANLRDRLEKQIYSLRKKYPLWGKEKLAAVLSRDHNTKASTSTVGRILHQLQVQGRIKPVRFMLYGKANIKRRQFNGHSQRWRSGMKTQGPGELVQIDHMTITMIGAGPLKHFTAVCPFTKITVDQVYREATSKNAADFLRQVQRELPFPLKSVQVDGGSEFMDFFERRCEQQNIGLYVLPPRSPECNGGVERGNGTMKYEFYNQYDGFNSLYHIQKGLQRYVRFYNRVRPHRAIGLLTPCQFFENLNMRPISPIGREP